MPKCERCGGKVSAFEITAQGLCPECSRMLDPIYVGEEAVARVREEDAKKKSDAIKEEVRNGDLPELPCITPKALKLTGGSLIFIEKRKNTTIPMQSIASFSNKKPSFMSNGMITIKLKKGSDSFVSIGGFSVGFGGELSAVYWPKYAELAEIYEKQIANWGNNPAPDCQPNASDSVINDLRALKQLVDEGVLTEEEFAAKKKQLLGI